MLFTTITDTLKKIQNKEISITELNKIYIDKIKKNIKLNAFIFLMKI